MAEFLRFIPLGWTADVTNLSIHNASASPGQPIVADAQAQGGSAWNELWQISPEGMIVCAADPKIAIGLQGNIPVCRALDATDKTQYWSFKRGTNVTNGVSTTGFCIINQSNGLYLNIPGGYTGASATVDVIGSSWPPQWAGLVWRVELAPSMFGYLQTAISGGANAVTPYVLDVASDSAGTNVVINPMSQGSLGQLWSIFPDFSIYSALSSSMVLQSSGSGGNVQLEQIITGSIPAQQWTRVANGGIALLSDPTNQVLNVQGGGLAKNQQVITWPQQTNALNEVWYFVTPPKQGFWFSIGTAAKSTDSDVPYYLTAYEPTGSLYAAVALGSDVVPSGLPAPNQLWRMTLDGKISCAICPQLVLTGTEGGWIHLAPATEGAKGQLWAWGSGKEVEVTGAGITKNVPMGVLRCVNLGVTANVLALKSAPTIFSNPVSLQSPQAGSDEQLWYVQPVLPGYDQWTSIRSGLSTDTSELVLNIDKNVITPGQAVITYSMRANAANSIWQFTSSGQIVSALDSQAVLSIEPGTDNVVIYPRQPGNPLFQQWRAGADGVIYSLLNGKVLTAAPNEGNVTVAPLVRDKNIPQPSQAWEFSPGAALSAILAQPAVPFPGATGTPEAATYQAINQALGFKTGKNTLRTQYANLAAPLAGYQVKLNGLACPTGIAQSDWSAAVAQLNEELMAAAAVQALFLQLSSLHTALSQMQSLTLAELVVAVGLSNSDQVTTTKRHHGWIYDIVMGVVYTALNVAGSFVGDPEAGTEASMGAKFIKNGLPVIANLLQAAFTSGQAAIETASSPPSTVGEDVAMTVLQLQQTLISMIQGAAEAIGEIETLVLSDWGKLCAVYAMIGRPAGVNSLFWPAPVTPMLVNKLMPGYIIGVLQALIPSDSKNTITRESQVTGSTTSAGLLSATTYAVQNSDGTQTKFSTTVDETVMNMVWANGGIPFSFFHAQGGWSPMPLNEDTKGQWAGEPFMVCFVQNFTPHALTLNASCGSDGKGQMCGNGKQQIISAYGVANFGAATSDAVGNPVDGGVVTVTQSDGTNVLNGAFNADGTSHIWSCSVSSCNSAAGYTVYNSFGGVMDDMVMWNIQIYWNPVAS